MRVTVIADPDAAAAPLLIELDAGELVGRDVGDLADRVIAAARAWLRGDAPPPASPARPEPPELPETPERPDPPAAPAGPDEPEQPAWRPDAWRTSATPLPDDEARHTAYTLFDRGRSVAQVAALLGVDRDLVRDWARRGRW